MGAGVTTMYIESSGGSQATHNIVGNGNVTRNNGSVMTYIGYVIRNLPVTLSRNVQNYSYYCDASD